MLFPILCYLKLRLFDIIWGATKLFNLYKIKYKLDFIKIYQNKWWLSALYCTHLVNHITIDNLLKYTWHILFK